MVTIGPAGYETDCAKFTQLILDRVKRKSTHAHQFADVSLLWWRGEEQSQQFRSHFGKQNVQNCKPRFDYGRFKLDGFKPSSSNAALTGRSNYRSK